MFSFELISEPTLIEPSPSDFCEKLGGALQLLSVMAEITSKLPAVVHVYAPLPVSGKASRVADDDDLCFSPRYRYIESLEITIISCINFAHFINLGITMICNLFN